MHYVYKVYKARIKNSCNVYHWGYSEHIIQYIFWVSKHILDVY